MLFASAIKCVRHLQVRALGVSNFGVRHLTELLADGPSLPIAVNQVDPSGPVFRGRIRVSRREMAELSRVSKRFQESLAHLST